MQHIQLQKYTKSNFSWHYMGSILISLIAAMSFIAWNLDLNQNTFITLCNYFCAPEIDCKAPILGSENWKICAANLAKQTLAHKNFKVKLRYKPLLALEDGENDSQYGPSQPFTSGIILNTGTQYQVQIQPFQPIRAYLFHQDSTGQITVLTPGKFLIPDHKVTFPGYDASYKVTNNNGTEHLYILLLPNRSHPLLDTIIVRLRNNVKHSEATNSLLSLLNKALANRCLHINYTVQPSQLATSN